MNGRWAFAILTCLASFGAEPALPPAEPAALERLTASPRHGEWAVAKTGTDSVDLWVVYPERREKAPVVLVIHEIYGLTDWARAVADSLAAEGFIAIAPDLLSGKAPDGKGSRSIPADRARALVSALDQEEVFRRLDAAAKYGLSLPAARPAFGVIGFCWGGAVSFGYATRQPDLKAAVVYYGTSPAKESLAAVKAPVLGLYGGNDARVNATVPAAEEELKRLGKHFEVEIYDGAGHAFLRQLDGQAGANLKAARAAWPRTLAFLRSRLETVKSSGIDLAAPELAGRIASCGPEDCLPGASPIATGTY